MSQPVITSQLSSTTVKTGLIVGIGLIGLVAFALLFSEQQSAIRQSSTSKNHKQVVDPAVDQAQIAAEYRQAIGAIVTRYRQGQNGDVAALAGSLRDQLLQLSVPSDARDLHLTAVVSLSRLIDDGTAPANLEAADQAIDALSQY